MRVVFVQFGDYAEAFQRIASSGKENYYAQKYTVGWVNDLAKQAEYTGVFCVSENYPESTLANGVHVYGATIYQTGLQPLLDQIEKARPTHLICCFPNRELIRFGLSKNMRVLPLLADSFEQKGIRSFFRNYLLKRGLNDPRIEWVANHNINACLSLKRIGVDPAKIIPWDYPSFSSPKDYNAKKHPENRTFKLIYVGSVSSSKGVEEAILALKHLKERGKNVSLTIAGDGELEKMQVLSAQNNLEQSVQFLGRIGHHEVSALMHAGDCILIPSRHDYPEGLPLTIYESFCSRTPLIASDHPMFSGKIIDRQSGLIFKAGNAEQLANCVETLIDNPELYEKLSYNSESAWQALQIKTKWAELLTHWLSNTHDDNAWLASRTLKNYPSDR